MRLPRTDLVPALAIMAGGIIGASLSLGPLILRSAPDQVRAPEPAEVSRNAPSALPTGSPDEVVVEAIEETNIEALITVWPYNVSTSGLVNLPEETFWTVLPNYNGGSAQGGDDRLIVVLQDPITRQGFADGFWPVIVKMPLADARKLRVDLARVISTRPVDENEVEGMESLIGTAVYSLDHNGQTTLYSEAEFQVLPRYISVDRQGEIIHVDDRLTVVLQDSERSFWPVIVRMDSAVAQAFLADLARVIEQKSEAG